MTYNPVLLFKPQGPQENNKLISVSDDDFLLAIQTEFQKDAMLYFGKKVILMDATHGTVAWSTPTTMVCTIPNNRHKSTCTESRDKGSN